MAQIIQPKSANFSSTLMLGDYGAINKTEMNLLAKLKTASLANDGNAGGALVYTGNATGAAAPSFAAGVLSVPDANVAAQFSRYSVPGQITSLSVTMAVLVRRTAARAQYIFSAGLGANHGVSLYMTSSGSIQGFFNNGSNRAISLGPSLVAGQWAALILSVSPTEMIAALNGTDSPPVAFDLHGGAPGGVARHYSCGTANPAIALHGDFSFLGLWNRSMEQTERVSTYRGLRAFADGKGIAV